MPSDHMRKVVHRKVCQLLQPDFEFDITDRIEVISDLDHYKASEDPFVWGEREGKIPEHYEVYWDGEWVLDFNEGTPPTRVYVEFLKRFAELYQQGKVHMNKFLTEHEQQMDIEKMVKKEKAKKELEKLIDVKSTEPVSGETEELAREVTKALEEDDGK